MMTGQSRRLEGKSSLKQNMDPSSYTWITELVQHKPDHLHSLQQVRFCEDNNGYREIFVSEKWDPPLSVDRAFEDVGVNLAVYVRSPVSSI
jgi:hypothetical protein